MDNRRLAIVAGLGIVELWIVGLMIRSVGGGHESEFSSSAADRPFASAAQGADAGRTAKTIETGPAPRVVIDDDDATLTVSVRSGTSVAVNEETQFRGWVHGANRAVVIEKTADGVRIARSGAGLVVSLGSVRRRLDVVVPPQARLEVINAGSTTVSGLRADATLHTDDGSIVIRDQRGSLIVKTDNGRIELHDVEAASVDVGSDNGRIVFDRVNADRVSVVTDNGRIEVARSLLRGGKIQTDSGRIGLALDPRSDVTVTASAATGKVVAQAPLTLVPGGGGGDDDEGKPSTIRVGNGNGRLEVASDDGSITVSAGGA